MSDNRDDRPARAKTESTKAFDGQETADLDRAFKMNFVSDILASDTRPTQIDLHTGSPTGRPVYIGSYRILEKLGEGGMGVVYLAEQRAPLRRRVALKLIKLGMDTRNVVARFESERQALALMEHSGIARVYDAGVTPDGRPYFVMEHVPGQPIVPYCDRHRVGIRRRLELFVGVCQAIQHAHEKSVIHRDIKPSNVLVMVEEGKVIPKVIDFGIAKATNQRLTEKTVFTELGEIIGTPEYVSPEQTHMRAADVDARTDVYSLGVLLYELLVGTLPFDREVLRRSGYVEFQRIIREEIPPRPSMRLAALGDAAILVAENRQTNPQLLRRHLRGDLDWIALKALEKDPSRRYASAWELQADVTRHLQHEPVRARPPGVTYRLRRYATRHRQGVMLGFLSLLFLVILGSVLLWDFAPNKNAPGADPIAADSAWLDLGNTNVGDGLQITATLDGGTEPQLCGSSEDQRITRRNTRGSRYISFRVTEPSLKESPELWVRGTFYDDPDFEAEPVDVALQYIDSESADPEDESNIFAGHADALRLSGSGRWIAYTWHIADAGFRNSMHRAFDFRFCMPGSPKRQICLDRVEVGIETRYRESRDRLALTKPADEVLVDLGDINISLGLTNFNHEDTRNMPAECGPPGDRRAARRNYKDSGYFQFRVNEPSVKDAEHLWIRGIFYDDPGFGNAPVTVKLDYTNARSTGPEDLSNTFAEHGDSLILNGSGHWVAHTWFIADAGFRDYMHEVADFRFGVDGDPPRQLCVDRVDVGVETEYRETQARLLRTKPVDEVLVDLGDINISLGLTNFNREDGRNMPADCGPPGDRRTARRNNKDSRNFQFRVTEPSVKAAEHLWIRGVFYDDPDFADAPVTIKLDYTNIRSTGPKDLSNTFAEHRDSFTLKGSGRWVAHTWFIADAGFRDYMHEAADFRFRVNTDQPSRLCLDRVDVGIDTEYKNRVEHLARTTPKDQVAVDLGHLDVSLGLTNENGGDGRNDSEDCGPPEDTRGARKNTDDNRYFYFRVTDPSVKAARHLRIRGVIYDDPDFADAPVTVKLHYTNVRSTGPEDLANTFAEHGDSLTLSGSGGWIAHKWSVDNAGFRDYMQGSVDFRFEVEGEPVPRICLDRVEVSVGPD